MHYNFINFRNAKYLCFSSIYSQMSMYSYTEKSVHDPIGWFALTTIQCRLDFSLNDVMHHKIWTLVRIDFNLI